MLLSCIASLHRNKALIDYMKRRQVETRKAAALSSIAGPGPFINVIQVMSDTYGESLKAYEGMTDGQFAKYLRSQIESSGALYYFKNLVYDDILHYLKHECPLLPNVLDLPEYIASDRHKKLQKSRERERQRQQEEEQERIKLEEETKERALEAKARELGIGVTTLKRLQREDRS